MARVAVVGGGAFGTAMACVLRRSGHDVLLWAREPEVAAAINAESRNPRFLPGVELAAGIRATAEIAALAEKARFVLLAPPAQHMRAVAQALRPHLAAGTPVVSCSKGIEAQSCLFMPEVLAEALPQARVAVLSGPSFAAEIARELPCGVALACADARLAAELAGEIANPRFRVHPGEDAIGTAVAGAMKNVIAIAAGIAAGRQLGESARATLLALGLEESQRLGLAKGARAATFLGLAGAGDAMLTASSLQSRNTAIGVALGKGTPARKELAEGVFSAAAAAALARRLPVSMPIACALDGILNRGSEIDTELERLLGA